MQTKEHRLHAHFKDTKFHIDYNHWTVMITSQTHDKTAQPKQSIKNTGKSQQNHNEKLTANITAGLTASR